MSALVETSTNQLSTDLKDNKRTVFYRITGKQSVERLDPLFQELNDPTLSLPFSFVKIGTYANNELLSPHESTSLLNNLPTFDPFLLWETTCEKELKPLHQQATIRNKLLNNTVIESKANFAFLQQLLPSDVALTTFVARTASEVSLWAQRRWRNTHFHEGDTSETPATNDWWVVKAANGNGGRDIWMIHAKNYQSELLELHEDQEYVIQAYVHNPLLYLNSKKFHFRCYGLVKPSSPEVYLYQMAFVLTAGLDYDPSITDAKRHVTNLSVNKHIACHPGQIPCHLPTEYPELYPRIQRLWRETVAAASCFMQQRPGPKGTVSLDFEFCGLDVIVDASGRCYLIEINRLPGLESSQNNLQEEDIMYDTMMRGLLRLVFVQPLLSHYSPESSDGCSGACDFGMWDNVSENAKFSFASTNDNNNNNHSNEGKDEKNVEMETQKLMLQNLLRWKICMKKHRRQVLAEYN